MANFSEVTDEDLERARKDPAFRHKLISDNLDVLLTKLNKMRRGRRTLDKHDARQIREGVDMAVKLAELLQTIKVDNEPSQAA